jgi:hypothetical protein|tara:strand:- start:48 stop:167 length:120 start_codon:yes stop_codon:yes gene_type:complete
MGLSLNQEIISDEVSPELAQIINDFIEEKEVTDLIASKN